MALTHPSFANQSKAAPDPWLQVQTIRSNIHSPSFPKRDFDIRKFGAVGNGRSDCTEAFRKAIESCHSSGGGRVIVPAGEFMTGAIHLLSRVNLHLLPGATIRFSHDPSMYPLVFTRYEGIELMNYSPFLYAFGQQDVAITGQGTIDGNADDEHWWPWTGNKRFGWKPGQPTQAKDRELLHQMGAKGIPVSKRVFGPGHHLRPNLMQPYRCQNVLIEGVTLLNSPMWNMHPVLSTNVTVRGVTVRSSGPNTDGCDPESCNGVLIENCTFDTGDDCIAIKSGRDNDGRRLHTPSENIVIRGCHMKRGHGGVTIGSEITGGVRNVFAESCRMDGPGLYDVLRLKNNILRGGHLENIYARNMQAGQVSDAGLSINDFYGHSQGGHYLPVIRNIELRKVTLGKCRRALDLRGLRQAPIQNVRVVDCDFESVAEPSIVQNVKGLSLDGVKINGKPVSHIAGLEDRAEQVSHA
jgi:polygalacturonase